MTPQQMLPQSIIERVLHRRGKLNILDTLRSRKTALLAIDLQNAYLAEDQPGYFHAGRRIIGNVNRLAAALRARGGSVVWIRNTLGLEVLQDWPVYGSLRRDGLREDMLRALTQGSLGHQLWAELDVSEQDLVLNKRRYSAFISGSSDIDAQLRARGVDTLIIAGVLANVCCESTARDAMMLNYHVVMAADATAAHSQEEHVATLSNILFAFGDVMDTDEIIERLWNTVTEEKRA
jgi:ureidoacrylate peracid hydrolase